MRRVFKAVTLHTLFIFLNLVKNINCASFTVTHQVFLEVRHNRESLGRIEIGLFGKDAPKTVKNFRHICTKGIEEKTYAGSRFHRVIDRFMIQGGDIISNDGFGSTSIYGKYFDDENLTMEHTVAGFVGMANRGPNTNGCQFYITTMATPWLNGKHSIFGRVVKGQDVVHKIEKVKTDTEDYPVKPVTITSCGEIHLNSPYQISDEYYTFWQWLISSGPPLAMSFTILAVFHYFIRKLSMFC